MNTWSRLSSYTANKKLNLKWFCISAFFYFAANEHLSWALYFTSQLMRIPFNTFFYVAANEDLLLQGAFFYLAANEDLFPIALSFNSRPISIPGVFFYLAANEEFSLQGVFFYLAANEDPFSRAFYFISRSTRIFFFLAFFFTSRPTRILLLSDVILRRRINQVWALKAISLIRLDKYSILKRVFGAFF